MYDIIDIDNEANGAKLGACEHTLRTNMHKKTHTRWPKEKDIPLFAKFKELCEEYQITTLEFLNISDETSYLYTRILGRLLSCSDWKGTCDTLLNRIKRISNKKGFSAREGRLLKKLMKSVRRGKTTMDEILKIFPGRSMKDIQEFIDDQMQE